MNKTNFLRALFVALVAGALPTQVTAQTTQMDGNCGIEIANSTRQLACDFRPYQAERIVDVQLIANGEELEGSQFTSFERDGKTAAWLFIIDRTDPARARDVDRHVEIVKDFASRASRDHKIGIATFSHDLKVHVDLENRNADLEGRLKDIKADGLSTEFFASTLEAVELLARTEADRRGLVIITDGKDEDTAYTPDEVVKKAREAGIVIYGMGFVPRENESPQLQKLRKMALATGGPSIKVFGNNDLPTDFKEQFFDYLTSGGTVVAPLPESVTEVSPEVRVEFARGPDIQEELELREEGAVSEIPAGADPAIVQLIAALTGEGSEFTQWARANTSLAWLLVFVPLLAVLLLIWLLSRRSSGSTEPVPQEVKPEDGPTTGPIPTDINPSRPTSGEVYGYFELVADQRTKFMLDQSVITIGRHSDNDVRLNNDSVHRHHAHLQRTDGVLTLTDLDTENGVFVNGKKVSRTALKPGDEITFGEVELRFFEA